MEEKIMAATPKFDFGIKKPDEIANTNLFAVTDPEQIKPYDIKNIHIQQNSPFLSGEELFATFLTVFLQAIAKQEENENGRKPP